MSGDAPARPAGVACPTCGRRASVHVARCSYDVFRCAQGHQATRCPWCGHLHPELEAVALVPYRCANCGVLLEVTPCRK